MKQKVSKTDGCKKIWAVRTNDAHFYGIFNISPDAVAKDLTISKEAVRQ